jgi:hypothetical protein
MTQCKDVVFWCSHPFSCTWCERAEAFPRMITLAIIVFFSSFLRENNKNPFILRSLNYRRSVIKPCGNILLEKISYLKASFMVTLCSLSSRYNRYVHAIPFAGGTESGATKGKREMCVCVCVCALVCVCGVHARCPVCPPLPYLCFVSSSNAKQQGI